MTTTSLLRRLLASLALVVVVGLTSATAAGADEPAPAYPPSPGGDEVVEAGQGQGPTATEPADEADTPDEGDTPDDEGAEGGEPGDGDEESAASPTGADGVPGADERSAARVLVLVGSALLLGGGVVAIARRI